MRIIGGKIYDLESVTSTNDKCAELIIKGAEEGIVVVAAHQTKGRGRFRSQWFSPKDEGLYLSIILKPRRPVSNPGLITSAAALAIANSVKRFTDIPVFIKWPNDVVLNSRKLAGVLVESKGPFLIAGIGINLNNKASSFPARLRDKATSLLIETGSSVSKIDFMKTLLEEFENQYLKFRAEETKEMIEEIKKASCTLGKHVKISNEEAVIEGEAVDIDDRGGLIMRAANGKISILYSGETL